MKEHLKSNLIPKTNESELVIFLITGLKNMNIVTNHKINNGGYGEVYTIKYNGEFCVLKIEKADPNVDIDNNSYSRQIQFDNFIKKSKYKHHFLTLKSHGWLEDCKRRLPPQPGLTANKKKYWLSKNKLNTCYFLIYSPFLQYTLYDAVKKAKTYSKISEIIGMCMNQLLPVVIDLHNNGYIHDDIHYGNIMYGSGRWYLIDYGRLRHKSWALNNQDKIERLEKIGGDFDDFLSLISISIYSPIKNQHKNFKVNSYKNLIGNIKKSDVYTEIEKKLVNIPHNYKNNFIEIYCELYYFDTYMKAFGNIPKNMNIEKSKLYISESTFNKIVNLIN